MNNIYIIDFRYYTQKCNQFNNYDLVIEHRRGIVAAESPEEAEKWLLRYYNKDRIQIRELFPVSIDEPILITDICWDKSYE